MNLGTSDLGPGSAGLDIDDFAVVLSDAKTVIASKIGEGMTLDVLVRHNRSHPVVHHGTSDVRAARALLGFSALVLMASSAKAVLAGESGEGVTAADKCAISRIVDFGVVCDSGGGVASDLGWSQTWSLDGGHVVLLVNVNVAITFRAINFNRDVAGNVVGLADTS